VIAQTFSKEVGVVLSFQTQLPFDRLEEWADLRRLPLKQQLVQLRDPAVRNTLVDAAVHGTYDKTALGAEAPAPDFHAIRLMDRPGNQNPTIAEVAAKRRCHPVDAMIDLSLERDLERFFYQVMGNTSEAETLELLRHPNSVITFSDSGAHVRQLINSSIQTHLLYCEEPASD